MKYRLLYAFPSGSHRWDLDRKKSFLPCDLDLYELINEELPFPMSFYYGKVRGEGEELVFEMF